MKKTVPFASYRVATAQNVYVTQWWLLSTFKGGEGKNYKIKNHRLNNGG